MKKLLILICLFPFLVNAQETNKFKTGLKKNLKFATFYGAINGGNSLADDNTYYLNNDGTIGYGILSTPFDYSLTFGVRKLARLGYENRANVFYDGTEKSFADASTIGRVKGLEFLFEADYKRQQGRKFVDHQHFLRYVAKNWIVKMEYVQDGFADIKYYESSQRYRYNINSKLSFNVGIAQRFSEPYGFNPLETQSYPYTNIALDQGYNYNFDNDQWLNSSGEIVAENSEVWRAIVLPQILDEYVKNEKSLLPNQWNHSLIFGYDYYHYTKEFWIHSWASVIPLHLPSKAEYSYYELNEGQWVDYGAGLIFGYKFNKSLGVFLEGKHNKYWNRNWYNFSVGFNYVII
tara:strand:- start:1413 stop:2456 length:1044 start_codon:yes stop_codon:yes gene_type:complete